MPSRRLVRSGPPKTHPSPPPTHLPKDWEEIAYFQIEVAKHWIAAAQTPGLDPAFQFTGWYGALNALYWLWHVSTGLPGRRANRSRI